MNSHRRKEIEMAIFKLEEAKDLLSQAGQDEQDYADNMPENMQGSEKYGSSLEIAEELVTLADEIDDIMSRAQSAIE